MASNYDLGKQSGLITDVEKLLAFGNELIPFRFNTVKPIKPIKQPLPQRIRWLLIRLFFRLGYLVGTLVGSGCRLGSGAGIGRVSALYDQQIDLHRTVFGKEITLRWGTRQ